MRPDEHKKKRSAQHQRKQAAGGAKGGKNESDKGTSKSGKSGASNKAEKTSAPHGAYRPTPQHEKKVDLSLSPSDSEDDEQRTSQRKTFSRREISSNWAKYDIPPAEAADASAAPKGQDFNKLLHHSGSATSHFRFKDEESWEDNGSSEGGTVTQVLSLDCNKLADSLDCLPLYAQLRLDTDIFSSEQVAAMDKSANEHRAQAGLPTLHQQQDNVSSQAASKSSSTTSATSVMVSESSGTLKPSTSLTQKQQTSAIDSKNNTKSTATNLQEGSTETKTAEKKQGASFGFSDADLDSLLETSGTEKREGGGVGSTVQSENGVSREETDVTEKDLDDLLAMDASQSNGPALSSNTSQKEPKASAESEDLEDWLDSVLDS
ncbi:cell death regulator Aven-like [Littorina saxatilis]|uniref:Cell death regulator Aven n=1 Tax=Littorina saxatilis TaxID=31220 RepID=A0AAN9BF09_9CAEN